MSSANVIRDGFPGGNRRSYIATETFTGRFYSYTTRTADGVTSGTLRPVTDDDALCPKGRILRENGRKLFPGANPDITQYYIGVYDAVTFLNGFIDPNSRVFSSYNTDKAYYIDNDKDSDHGSVNDDQSVDEGNQDLGDPVYTSGNIEALANPGYNYISIQDVSGSYYARLNFEDDYTPKVSVNAGDGTASGYLVATTSFGYPPNAILLLSTATGLVAAESAAGDIFNSGVLHPYNACGTVIMTSNTGTVVNPLFDVSGVLVMLTRQTVTAGAAGHLTYSIGGGNTMTVSSDSGYNHLGVIGESSVINYLIISSSSNTMPPAC